MGAAIGEGSYTCGVKKLGFVAVVAGVAWAVWAVYTERSRRDAEVWARATDEL